MNKYIGWIIAALFIILAFATQGVFKFIILALGGLGVATMFGMKTIDFGAIKSKISSGSGNSNMFNNKNLFA